MVMRRFARGLAAFLLARSLLKQQQQITYTSDDRPLEDFIVQPGRWFGEYLADWMAAHEVDDQDNVTSGIARGAETLDYIWVTATPEWDEEWFRLRGFRFPVRWVPFHFLALAEGEPGGPCYLRGL